ncbi:adenylosuccinate lyase [Streptomyces mashuensis]|uniref:Adenylosuccinate lyase n=1 Tax=Streptomyces mashuensis TaxID=33904 RepID=A0A919E960_9ACTN|nr:HEAT repeat domain-containing protein [Streptomyces mashuensis]GHF26321.1 adenylosuccinate lyase [Streptomyces mashuensis]
MDPEFRALLKRVRAELVSPAEFSAYEHLLKLVRTDGRAARDELAGVLVAPERPLWAREIAAFALGVKGDRRAFETLVLLLNYREPARCATAAHALALLRDPRTAKAAAALATNPVRTAYAVHPVRLLAELRAPESVPALMSTLERLLVARDHCWPVARACVEGLGRLGDRRAEATLVAAREHPQLRPAAVEALARLTGRRGGGTHGVRTGSVT